ncbi:pre-rRNA-processing protein esf1 [Typha latifolia]|uniref:pre-rRNA-processing protein esf1 n=1 Tax=Typha latifolia TaxID=4733 RepID=UPI003C2CC5F8
MATGDSDEKRKKKEKKNRNKNNLQELPDKEDHIESKKNKKRKLRSPHDAAPEMKGEDENTDAKKNKKKGKKDKTKSKNKEKNRDGEGSGGGGGEEEEEEEEGVWKKNKKSRAITDERFSSAQFDPRFRRMPRKESKVTIDSRFARIFSDKNFAPSAAPVDKRGKPRKGDEVNPLLHYYLHQEDKEEEERVKDGRELEVSDEEEDSQMELNASESDGSTSTEDEEDDDDDDDQYSVNSDIVHYLMANHEDTPLTENETHRLAAVNMDWDHIKAVDLYVVMTSCLPKGGQISSVAVYPSEFGIKCMEIEAVHGPSGLFDVDNGDDDSENDSDIDNNKLRNYELNKLRYYYAVVECDSSATSSHLYKTLDGTELLKTSNVFDLRFIPDSMEFKNPPRDVATEAPVGYKEPDFQTRALQHSRVKLTWEDDEPERKKILRRQFKPNQLDELNDYLASTDESDDDDDDDDNDKVNDVSSNNKADSLPIGEAKKRLGREKFLALLQSGDDSDADKSDKDMEITFNTELEDLSKRIIEKKDRKSETVWEAVLRKRSEKKKARKRRSGYSDDDSSDNDGQGASDEPDDFFVEEPSDTEIKPRKENKEQKSRGKGRRKGKDQSPEKQDQEASRAELELLFADDQDADHGPKGYNLKAKKAKGKKGKEKSTEDKIPDVKIGDDPRFSALFTSHHYALDPTDPQYKRSAPYIRQRSRKQEMSTGEEEAPEDALSKPDKQVI